MTALLSSSLLLLTITWVECQLAASTDINHPPPTSYVNYVIHFDDRRPNYIQNRFRDADDGQITFSDPFISFDETRSALSDGSFQNTPKVVSAFLPRAAIPDRSRETTFNAAYPTPTEEHSGGRANDRIYFNNGFQQASSRRPCCSYGRDRDLEEGRIIFPGTAEYDEMKTHTYGKRKPFQSVNRPHLNPTLDPSAHNAFAHSSLIPNFENTERTTPRNLPVPSPTSNVEDVSVNVIPQGPSRCIWAIISCCTRKTNEVRHQCFELLGCQGSFWDTNPCESNITDKAVKMALDFYNKG